MGQLVDAECELTTFLEFRVLECGRRFSMKRREGAGTRVLGSYIQNNQERYR